jgi:hypothetical protein
MLSEVGSWSEPRGKESFRACPVVSSLFSYFMCQNQVILEMAQKRMISRFFLPESFLIDKSTRELSIYRKKIPGKVLLKLAIIFCL